MARKQVVLSKHRQLGDAWPRLSQAFSCSFFLSEPPVKAALVSACLEDSPGFSSPGFPQFSSISFSPHF